MSTSYCNAEPTVGLGYMLYWCCPLSQEVPRLVALCRRSEFSGTAQLLSAFWKGSRGMLMHRQQEPLLDAANPDWKAKPSCLIVGACVCGVDGDFRHKLKVGLYMFMKRTLHSS